MENIRQLIDRVSDYNRTRKYDLFYQLLKPERHSKILDIGASEKEYRSTSNILEKKYPHQENITVLGVDNYNHFIGRYPKVNVLRYGGGVFPFKDKSFDICFSNAVIEHVGDIDKQELFVKEVLRVAHRAFITTPNKYFIFEPHTKVVFLHYLPRNIFNRVLTMTKNTYPGDRIHLLGLKNIKRILQRNNIIKYEIIKNKILGFTIDFVIIL